MRIRIINTIESIAKRTWWRRIGLALVLLFLVNINALVDSFHQPDLAYFSTAHLIVGLISGLVGFFFMIVTAYLVRRLDEAELDRHVLEQHFDYLSKYANDSIILVNAKRRIIEVNDRALTTYGYSREEMLGLDAMLLLAPEERRRGMVSPGRIAITEGAIFESRHRRKDGTEFFAEISARVYLHAGMKYYQGTVRDITDRKRTEEVVQRQSDRLRSLGIRLEQIREEERKNLARELHDQVGQELTAIKMNIAVLAPRLKHDELLTEKMLYIRGLVDDAIQSIRKISTSLRPDVLDQLGLDAAIVWQLREFEKQFLISCTHQIAPAPGPVKEGVSIALIRILQESLTNVARHADATQVMVKFEVLGTALQLTMYDNGKGMSEGSEDKVDVFGILGMKERAREFGGTVEVSPRSVKGTRVTARIPEAML